jgi:hypothetical protein
MTSTLRKYLNACDEARRTAGYDDVVVPVRGLPLVSLGYEDERTDLHGFAIHGWSRHDSDTISVLLSCYCGHDLAVSADHGDAADWNAAEDAAVELFVAHADAALVGAA